MSTLDFTKLDQQALYILQRELEGELAKREAQKKEMIEISDNFRVMFEKLTKITPLISKDIPEVNSHLAIVSNAINGILEYANLTAKATGTRFSFSLEGEIVNTEGYGYDTSAWQGSSYNC